MTVPVTDLTIRFVTSYSVLFSMAHFMYIRYISTYIALRACMYVCMYVCVCVCVYIYICVCVGGGWVSGCARVIHKTARHQYVIARLSELVLGAVA